MNILGVELEFDFFDADQIEVYERENQAVVTKIKEPTQYEGKSTADAIRIQCRIVNEFFDNIFGSGTADRIFHGKNNIKDHMEAFSIMANGAYQSNVEFDAISEKYNPNRATRRQAERQGQRQNMNNFQRNAWAAHKGKKRDH